MLKINKIYDFFDEKFTPITGYFYVSPKNEIKDCIINLKNKCGVMRDFFGYEYEDNNTITFYDFTGGVEKSINVQLNDLLVILSPMIDDYLKLNPMEKLEIENLIISMQN
jgi:hypothetical protein